MKIEELLMIWKVGIIEYALNKAASHTHPNIFEFIITLRKEHAKIKDDMKLIQRGKKGKRVYIKNILNLNNQSPAMVEWIKYMDNISYFIKHND